MEIFGRSLCQAVLNGLLLPRSRFRVRAYDLRTSKPVCSLYGHQLGVSAVQMDDWKIVSGGEEGLVCVWDQRMGTKLWEMHAR